MASKVQTLLKLITEEELKIEYFVIVKICFAYILYSKNFCFPDFLL